MLVAPLPFESPSESALVEDDEPAADDPGLTGGPEVTVSPLAVNATEGGATGTYNVVLAVAPVANVDLAISAGGGQVTVAPATLTFTPANWNTPQTVTVTAVDDATTEGLHGDTLSHSATSTDTGYDGLSIADVTVTVADNEPAAVSYDANGATYGTAPADPTSYTPGDTVTTATNTGGLVQDGAVFAGWNTASDGSGTSYAAGGTFTITGDTTLYADWDASNNGFAGGSGTAVDPYQIATHEHLSNIRTDLTASYELIGNVDLNVPPWNADPWWDPIGPAGTPFEGDLNGNGYEIQGLTRNDTGAFALIDIAQNATIENLGVTNVSIQGGNTTAPLVLSLETGSLIRRVYATGALQTFTAGGGIVSTVNGGTIEESFTNVDITITGLAPAGGIAAEVTAGVVRNSYSMGFVDIATFGVGGFASSNAGTIEYSFSIGTIVDRGRGFLDNNTGTVTSNFYDSDTSGQTDTTGAQPRTTTQMQTLATFAGWDISTGTGTVWGIVDGSSYPYLNWEPPGGPGLRP